MRVAAKSVIRICLTLATVGLCTGHIDMMKYKQMPPLYAADDYDQCLSHGANSYCMVYAEIPPQPASVTLQNIDEFHKNMSKTHFRHDVLYRGVCTSRCQNYVKSQEHWNVQEIQPTSENVEMAHKQYALSRSQKVIAAYEQQLHHCVNEDMRGEYNVSVKTFVRYCENPKEPIENDTRYTLGVFVLIAILAVNLLSTIYDAYLRAQQNIKDTNDYYDTKHKSKVHHYLTTFSLYRNFRRLIKPNSSPIGKDLQLIDGFRSIMSMVIVLEHVIIVQFFPITNTELFEDTYSSTYGRWALHLMPCIECFFVMTGLLLYIKFARGNYISTASSWCECVRVFVRMMISRYLRYMPSVLLLIFFTSNMFLHLGDGPFWRHSIEPTVLQCRSKWWYNVLITANSHPNDICWAHTWYIAADFQLYGIFLFVLIITTKCPQLKKLVYTIVALWGLLTPSVLNYINNYMSITIFMPEQFRHFYFKDVIDNGIPLYMHSYTNLNGCFVGIICGELYMKYLKHDMYKKMWERYLRPTPLIGWSIIFSIWYLGAQIIFNECTIWTSLFAILHRHLSIAIVATIVILRGLCTGGGFLAYPSFRPLARISYQVYLWHVIGVFTTFATRRHLLEVSYFYLIYMFLFFYILAAILATVVATMVENPIAEILTVFDLKNKPKAVKSAND